MSDKLKACPHGRNFCLECHYDPASPSKTLPQMYDDLLAENAALRAQLPSQGGEAVEVVAHMYQHEETGVTGFVDQQQVDWGFEKNNPRLHLCGPLMTVAQHQRILAASMGSGDPVGYVMTDAERLRTDGRAGRVLWFGELTPGSKLYTHPADQVADDLTMVKVSRELLELLCEMVDLHDRRGAVLTVHMEHLRTLLANQEGVKP